MRLAEENDCRKRDAKAWFGRGVGNIISSANLLKSGGTGNQDKPLTRHKYIPDETQEIPEMKCKLRARFQLLDSPPAQSTQPPIKRLANR